MFFPKGRCLDLRFDVICSLVLGKPAKGPRGYVCGQTDLAALPGVMEKRFFPRWAEPERGPCIQRVLQSSDVFAQWFCVARVRCSILCAGLSTTLLQGRLTRTLGLPRASLACAVAGTDGRVAQLGGI